MELMTNPGDRLGRRNALYEKAELWKPPVFVRGSSPVHKLRAWARRFVDLQAGSIYRDLAVLLPARSGSLVDVGCGAQPYRELTGSGVKYVGIDTSDAKANFGYEIPDTIYYSGDTWPIDTESADTVLCTETLEHVLEPDAFLREAARCLRPGGLLIITVPFAARWHYIPHDYYRYTPSGIAHLLYRAGLQDVGVYPRGNPVTVACYKVIALQLLLFFPQDGLLPIKVLRWLLGVLALPIIVGLAAIANISLSWGGDDCIGYTVTASKPPDRQTSRQTTNDTGSERLTSALVRGST